MRPPERLYGTPGAEYLSDSLIGAYEQQIDPFVDEHDDRAWMIEEWTVRPAIAGVPSARWIADMVGEWMADNGEFDEDPFGNQDLSEADDVIGAAEALRLVVASKITWHMAERRVATYAVTFDSDLRPIFSEVSPHDAA